MFLVDGLDVTITRGDTAALELTFEGDAPGASDAVIAQVRKRPNAPGCEIEKELTMQQDGTWLLELASGDTEAMPFGLYCWDVRILYSDGQVTTPFAPARFRVAEVVTELPEQPLSQPGG